MREERIQSFFSFMEERERIRLKRLDGKPWPWSDDPIFQEWRFTNVKREHDRTTVWMRKNWTNPNSGRPAGEIVFNCALFRYFGSIDLLHHIGWQRDWVPEDIKLKISKYRSVNSNRVYTNAYIIPSMGQKGPKHAAIVDRVLTPLWQAKERLADIAAESNSWEQTGQALMQLPGFGGTGFLAKEVLQDVLNTPVLQDACDRNDWCPAGPGARRGLNRMSDRAIGKSISDSQALVEMKLLFKEAGTRLSDWMPELELHDIQFQLCEFDKYERVRLNEGRPRRKFNYR